MRFFPADHFRAIIIFILALVIISLIFSLGILAGKDKSQSAKNQATDLNSAAQDNIERQEIDKDKLVGDDQKDCKASGGIWTFGPLCGVSFTCDSKYQDIVNPVWYTCRLDEKKYGYCECGQGFCWDGESCVDFKKYMDGLK